MFYSVRTNQLTPSLPFDGYLEDGTLVQGLNIADEATQRACGVYPVKSSTPQPANTYEDISQRVVSVEEDGVVLTQVWLPAPSPPSISARQIRLWLIEHGVSLATIDSAIAAIPDALLREKTKVEWEFAPYVERTHPMINAIGEQLGLTPEQIDQAFVEGSAL